MISFLLNKKQFDSDLESKRIEFDLRQQELTVFIQKRSRRKKKNL